MFFTYAKMQLKVFYNRERTLTAETDVLSALLGETLHSPWGMPTIRLSRKKSVLTSFLHNKSRVVLMHLENVPGSSK